MALQRFRTTLYFHAYSAKTHPQDPFVRTSFFTARGEVKVGDSRHGSPQHSPSEVVRLGCHQKWAWGLNRGSSVPLEHEDVQIMEQLYCVFQTAAVPTERCTYHHDQVPTPALEAYGVVEVICCCFKRAI